jgi:hypothetical protein
MSNFHIGNVSGTGNIFGDNGRITHSVLLRDLGQSIREHADELQSPADMVQAEAELEDELALDPPDPGRIARVLHRLRQGAGTVVAVTAAVDGIERVLDVH